MMHRQLVLMGVLSLLISVTGCQQQSPESRSYSPEKDGTDLSDVATGSGTSVAAGETQSVDASPNGTSHFAAGSQGESDGSNGPDRLGDGVGVLASGTGNGSAVLPETSHNSTGQSETISSSDSTGATNGAPSRNPLENQEPVSSPVAGRPPLVPIPQPIAMLTTGETGGDKTIDSSEFAFPKPGSLRKEERREIKLLIPERTFVLTDPDQSLRVSYDDLDLLKVLNMEPVPENAVEYFPSWLSGLDGKQVRLRGFMIPTTREKGLTAFRLARDNQICCFQRTPMVYDVFPVFLRDGETTNYIQNRPFDVVGTFHIRPDVYKGEVENLYVIENAIVIDK